MPYAIEGYGFVYNKDIFEAAGIDASKLKTYDEAYDFAFGMNYSGVISDKRTDRYGRKKEMLDR